MDIPGTELAIRDWLRGKPTLVAAVGGDPRRIDVDYSGPAGATHLTMFRAGGGQNPFLPIDDAVMSLHCWGRGRGAALTLCTALVNVLVNSKEEAMTDAVYLRGSIVESQVYLPDPSGQARYVVTARVMASARQAAA